MGFPGESIVAFSPSFHHRTLMGYWLINLSGVTMAIWFAIA